MRVKLLQNNVVCECCLSTTQCSKPVEYGDMCRDCYESMVRRQAIDAYDRDSKVRARMMLHKERCRMRLCKNYSP